MTFGGKHKTMADNARFDAIKRGPCMACIQRGVDLSGQGLVEVHHLQGRKRHDLTVGLCQWCHRSRVLDGMTHKQMREEYGPSLAEGSKPFHARYGDNNHLLALQQEYLGDWSGGR